MDVDNDIDSQLLQQFSSMGTTDREVLISEFQKLLGNRLNPESCAFFLDMNNWNLQAAICAYYDYEQPNIRLPKMLFISDVTIGEGESVPPNAPFVKTWRIQNNGDEQWPPGCCLKFVGGEKFCNQEFVMVETLRPGQITDISIHMQSPASTGMFQGQWRMTTPVGHYFGEVIWVIIQVEEAGLLSLTQKLNSIGNQEFNQDPRNFTENPFGSPNKLGAPGGPGGWSPTPSTVAQFGSTPSSPCSTPLQGTQVTLSSSAPSTPASHVRVALFPTPDGSPQQDSNQQPNDMDMS